MRAPGKYGNKPTVLDGIRFASKREAARHGELRLLEKAGEISDLQLQTRFKLDVNGIVVCTYVADFTYAEKGRKFRVVEDCKGARTPLYKLKAKLMLAVFKITIRET